MGKKIKITEAQARSLGLINENVDMLTQFEQFCKIKTEEVNRLYSSTIMINIDDIIEQSTRTKDLLERLEVIDDQLRTASRKVENVIIGHPNEDELDSRFDNASSLVIKKISSLQSLLGLIYDYTNQFIELDEKYSLKKDFIDIKPIDITSSQS